MYYQSIVITISAVIAVINAQFSIGGQSSQSGMASQYPRIKIGGPLGQLIPNGINLGSGLGSMLNQLIGSTTGSGNSGGSSSSASSPYVNAMRGYGGASPYNQMSSQLSAYNSPLSTASLYGSASSQPYSGLSSASLYGGGPQAKYPGGNPFGSSFSPYSSSFSDGLYGSASSPLGYNSFGSLSSQSQPSLGSSSLYSGSLNPSSQLIGME